MTSTPDRICWSFWRESVDERWCCRATPSGRGDLWALGKALHRPTVLPVPAAALRLAFGELGGVLLASQRVVPRVAERTGYRFAWPDLDAALRAMLTN